MPWQRTLRSLRVRGAVRFDGPVVGLSGPEAVQAVMSGNVNINSANGVYIDTGFFLDLPSGGKFLVTVSARAFMNFTGSGSAWILTKLKSFNGATDEGDVPHSGLLVVLTYEANTFVQAQNSVSFIVEVPAARRLKLYVSRNVDVGGALGSSAALISPASGETSMVALKVS